MSDVLSEMITQSSFFHNVGRGNVEIVQKVLDGTLKVALFGSPEEKELIERLAAELRAKNPKFANNAQQAAQAANATPEAPQTFGAPKEDAQANSPQSNPSQEDEEDEEDEEETDEEGEKIVHDLHRYDHTTTIRIAVENEQVEVLKLLLGNPDAAIHLNYCHKAGGSALMTAVRKQNVEIVGLLLEAGADASLNAEFAKFVRENQSAGNALVDAAGLEDLTIFDMIVERGFDPVTTLAADKKNALMHAVYGSSPKNVRRMLGYGFDVNAKTQPTEKELEMAREQHAKAKDGTEFDPESLCITALGFVDFFAGDDAVDVFHLLVSKGADVNQSKQASPILFEAMSHDNEDLIEFLLEHGCDPNVRNPDGLTALSKAVVFNTPFVVKKLLRAGANPYLKHPNGKTAYDFLKGRTWEKKEIEGILWELSQFSPPVEEEVAE